MNNLRKRLEKVQNYGLHILTQPSRMINYISLNFILIFIDFVIFDKINVQLLHVYLQDSLENQHFQSKIKIYPSIYL